MEGILGSPALFHSTQIMVMEPYNDSDNCSPLAQSISHREGMARRSSRSSDEGEWHFNGQLLPWPERYESCVCIHYQRRDGKKGV